MSEQRMSISADYADMLRVGEGLAIELQRGRIAKEPKEHEIVWALTVEAAQVFKRQRSPMPTGYPSESSLPDPLVHFWEQFATMREQISNGDKIRQIDIRVPITTASVDRSEIMQRLWSEHAFRRRRDRVVLLKLYWLWASGITRPAKLMDAYGLKKTWLYKRREEGCQAVADAMRWKRAA